MFRTSMFMGGALLFCSAASAQTTTQAMQSCPAPVYDGVYHYATGTFTKAKAEQLGNTQNAGTGGVVYHNTCPSGYYYNIADGATVIDEGQILSTGSGGSQDSYNITSFDVGYCTSADDVAIGGPGTRIIVSIIENYDPCADLASSEAPLVTFDLTGLPGSDPSGFSCHIVTIDLTGSEFCILGDADGTYGGDPTLDNFGFTYTFPDAAGASAGPFISGDAACAVGDGTVWQNPGADGTGTGNQNLFVKDGAGCYWFGGVPFGGFHMSITSDLAGDCAGGCTSDDECDCATAIAGDGSFAFDTTGYTTSANQDCTSVGQDLWLSWTAGADGDVTIDTCGSSFDTKLAVHATGSCGGGGCLGWNDDACGLQSSVIILGVTTGDELLLQIGGFGSGSGAGTLNVNTVGGSCAPANDDCATPDIIAGDGSFAFDTTCATTGAEGQANAACDFFGQPDMNDDVWFEWTAMITGNAVISLCGAAGDTKLAIYDGGGCPTAEPLACNDDSCGLLSEVTTAVTAGNVYVVQVATFSAGGAASGMMDIATSVSGPANDECSSAEVVTDGTYPFDSTHATTGAEGQANAECDFFGSTVIDNDLWYEYTSSVNGVLVVTVCAQTGVDTKMAGYHGAGCPSGAPEACNDDDCGLQSTIFFPVVAGETYVVQLGTYPGSSGGSGTVTFLAQDLGLGQNYCYSTPNSTGYPAIIASAGSDVVADNNLTLTAGPAPIGETGIFFYGLNQNSVPLGNGIRCIGPGNYRVLPPVSVVDSGSGLGFMSTMVDLFNPPQASGTITAGSTWNFQGWFRDSAAGSTDLSDAQEISFN